MNITPCRDPKTIAKLNKPVQDLHHSLYPDQFKPFHMEEVTAYFKRTMEKDNHYFYICLEEGQALGYVWYEDRIKSESAFKYASHSFYINHMSILHDHRGKGVGKKLVGFVDQARKAGASRVGLDFWNDNMQAGQAFERMGFRPEGHVAYMNVEEEK